MNLDELVTTMAILEERDELEKLEEIGLPPGNAIQWLFGLTAGLYFANGETPRIRRATLDIALRYYDFTEGKTNLGALGERSHRISSKDDIEHYLEQANYADEKETVGFYIRHMPAQSLRSTDPVYEYLTALLPGLGYRGGNANLMYQMKISELFRDPDSVISFFVKACRELQVFYAVSGLSLLFYSYASGATTKAYPLFRRFPGLLYEDGARFGLAIRDRTDAIRDINWLTAVNDELLARVGGLEKAYDIAGNDVVLHPYDGGVVFQAGQRPALGDQNKGRVPKAYRIVNDFLKPLRFNDWTRPYLRAPFDVDKMQYTESWMKRFDEVRK